MIATATAATGTVTHRPEGEKAYTEDVSTLPEIKLASGNALAMLDALGVEPDLCGTWAADELPEMLRRAQEAAKWQAGTSAVLSTDQERGAASPGHLEDYVAHTAVRFVDLFRQALAGGYSVIWG